MGEVHARIPMVAMHDRQTDQVKTAKADLQRPTGKPRREAFLHDLKAEA